MKRIKAFGGGGGGGFSGEVVIKWLQKKYDVEFMDCIQLVHVNMLMNLRVSDMPAVSLTSGPLTFHQQGHFFVELIHIAEVYFCFLKSFSCVQRNVS
jgi:hypothetical protein